MAARTFGWFMIVNWRMDNSASLFHTALVSA